MARWLASFADLAGIVLIREDPSRVWKRLRWETRRIGLLRMLDVLAFRVYYRLFLSGRDRRWKDETLARLHQRYPPVPESTPVFHTSSPNLPESEAFLRELAPDIVIARCKFILPERIFSIPRDGTFVLHPGICPEYRNAHGCFWALANGDEERVGVTLLRIDKGIDTGPVYGYFGVDPSLDASHIVIQYRGVYDNLDAIAARLTEIHQGRAGPLDTSGRRSQAWGQPWLTRYVAWKRRAGREAVA